MAVRRHFLRCIPYYIWFKAAFILKPLQRVLPSMPCVFVEQAPIRRPYNRRVFYSVYNRLQRLYVIRAQWNSISYKPSVLIFSIIYGFSFPRMVANTVDIEKNYIISIFSHLSKPTYVGKQVPSFVPKLDRKTYIYISRSNNIMTSAVVALEIVVYVRIFRADTYL